MVKCSVLDQEPVSVHVQGAVVALVVVVMVVVVVVAA